MNKRGKKAQLEINFSMIFSIILIIAFIAVAIYAIMMFLDVKKCGQLGLFKEDFQNRINQAWSSDEASFDFEYTLPGNIEQVCFIDLSKEGKGEFPEQYDKLKKAGTLNINMFFYPLNNDCGKRFEIEHIDIENITKDNNPYCIENSGKLEIKKGFYESLVNLK